MTTEVEFADKYQDLIRFVCAEKDAGVRVEDIASLAGFATAKLEDPVLFTRAQGGGAVAEPVTVTFRSIRPPKFSKKLELQSDGTVLQAKRVLAEALKKDGMNVEVEQLILMLKTKTVHDGIEISSIAQGPTLTLNVLVSKPKKVEVVEPVKEVKKVTPLSDGAWDDILKILETEIPDKNTRDAYYERLRAVKR